MLTTASNAPPIAQRDLQHVLDSTRDLWRVLDGERLFITGGTGFIGCWLLETFLAARREFGLNTSAVVLTRNPERFAAKCPHIANDEAIELYPGHVSVFDFPRGTFRYVIHAATDASDALNRQHPLQMFDTIVAGTRRTLEFAESAGSEKVILTSSGAVYGRQPTDITHVREDYGGGPDPTDPRSGYAEGKRAAELLCSLFAARGIEIKIARCFAFVGPHLPLDIHFAIGNFIRDVMEARPIEIRGDGTPLRSYLYAADLAVWLWTILFRGEPMRPYNVGSDEAMSLTDVARHVAECGVPRQPIHIAQPADALRPPERYVPSTERAQTELGLRQWIDLPDAIHRTIDWYARW